MRDLVEPRPRVLGLLEGVVVSIRLDERVLREVGGELGVAKHPDQVGVDLGVVRREQVFDETGSLIPLPGAAHGRDPTESPGPPDLIVERADHLASGIGGEGTGASGFGQPLPGQETTRIEDV